MIKNPWRQYRQNRATAPLTQCVVRMHETIRGETNFPASWVYCLTLLADVFLSTVIFDKGNTKKERKLVRDVGWQLFNQNINSLNEYRVHALFRLIGVYVLDWFLRDENGLAMLKDAKITIEDFQESISEYLELSNDDTQLFTELTKATTRQYAGYTMHFYTLFLEKGFGIETDKNPVAAIALIKYLNTMYKEKFLTLIAKRLESESCI